MGKKHGPWKIIKIKLVNMMVTVTPVVVDSLGKDPKKA